MKRCDQCGEREGVVDLTQIEGTEVKIVHLCAKCAAEKGIQTAAGVADTPLGGLLAALGSGGSAVQLQPVPAADSVCPHCGATLQDFRETGRLGCADCYTVFAEPLRELLRRLHGSAHHTGKFYNPPGGNGAPATEEPTHTLRERLRRAVEAEQFELAAELRDRLKERE